MTQAMNLTRNSFLDTQFSVVAVKTGFSEILYILLHDGSNEFDEEYFEFGLFMSRREYKTINRRLTRGRDSSDFFQHFLDFRSCRDGFAGYDFVVGFSNMISRGRDSSAAEGKYINSIAPYGYKRVKLPNEKGFDIPVDFSSV